MALLGALAFVTGCGPAAPTSTAEEQFAEVSQSETRIRGTAIYGKHYRYTVLATSGEDDLKEIHPEVGINERGQVVFVGTRNSGAHNIYIGARGQAPLSLNPSYISTRRIGSGVQLSNTPVVVAYETDTTGGNFIRTWTPTAVGSSTLIAKGGTTAFDRVSAWPAINDADRVAFVGFKGSSFLLATPKVGSTTFNTLTFSQPLRPVISGKQGDSTFTLAQVESVTGPLRTYSDTLAPLGSLVQSGEFSEIGRWPAISKDGRIVVFYGTLTSMGSINYDITNQGPGIFAAFEDGGVRRVVRLAGRDVQNLSSPVPITGNLDGVCDSGEDCIPGELGFGPAGEPYSFAEFYPNSRVSIAHQELGAPGLDDDSFVVAFDASATGSHPLGDFKAGRGIWTVQVDLVRQGGSLVEKPHRPMVVIQQLDKLGDFVVSEISTDVANPALDGSYAQLASARLNLDKTVRAQTRGEHRVALYVKDLADTTMVVLAERLDSDEDGLPDHWEEKSTASVKRGIDFDQDGTIDLELAKLYGVKPKQKDILVEYDFMAAADHSHEPHEKRMEQIRAEFARHGYFLHLFKGDALTEVTPITFTRQPPRPGMTPAGSFYTLKYGDPIDLCGKGNLGSNTTRNDKNCLNERLARNMAFRYVIFGHQNATAEASGIAEPGGNDILVAPAEYNMLNGTADQKRRTERAAGDPKQWCQPNEPDLLTCGYNEIHASAFMHELGHSLGLLHGGGQLTNCKPNYPSIMSYSLQFASLNPKRPRSYSSIALNPLDKRVLDEAVGIPNFPLSGPPSRPQDGHGMIVFGSSYGSPEMSTTAVPVDWDGDGLPTAGTFPEDITYIVPMCPANQLPAILEGYDDWANLKLDFRDRQDHNVSYSGVPLHDDFPVYEHISTLASLDTDGDGVSNLDDNCVSFANPGQEDANGNGVGNACEFWGTIDVALSTSATPNPVLVGSNVKYTFALTQTGTLSEPDVILRADLSENTSFISAVPSQGKCVNYDATLVCTLERMNPGASASLTVTLRAEVPGTLSASGEVTTSLLETDETNNGFSVDVEAVCETDAQLCARLGKTCGQVTGLDNCGVSRTVLSCGTCPDGQTCNILNVCQ